jgi:hypothetical protein
MTVVWDTCLVTFFVAAESCLPPPPGILMMESYAITHTMFMTGINPFTKQITLGTYIHRVPRLITRVPEVEIIMMHALNHQKSCSCFLIELREIFRIEFRWIPIA